MTARYTPEVKATYHQVGGREARVPEATIETLRALLEGPEASAPLPRRHAYVPPVLKDGGRAWGVAVQLYAIRSRRNWGMGDFTDLAEIVRWTSRLGGAYVAVNPLHALFAALPSRPSPYYPSSRLWLNPLYIDPEAVAVGDEAVTLRTPEAERLIEAARGGERISYAAVAAAKRPAFEALWSAFKAHANAARRTQFEQFREEGGQSLHRHALFEAIHEHLCEEGEVGGFLAWPEAYRDPEGEAVRDFAEANDDRVAFHAYLQWVARLQLEAAANVGVSGDYPTTLYLDLAVGAAPDGSEVWSGGEAYVPGVRLGAPPDPMAMSGQDWGLTPLHPARLASTGYAAWRAVLKASMRYAGALRIDHVLGYDRQFWIPDGVTAAEGGYVAFPRSDLIAVTAEESEAASCLVIGEDLGTVPEGLTEALHEAGILSYEVARWAQDEDGFYTADRYPRDCLAVATTHDVAPIAGWLAGTDIEAREAIDGARDDDARWNRGEERANLLRLWGVAKDASPREVIGAAHEFLGRTSAAVVMVALEDLLLQETQVNMPGTTDEHPNWRVRTARDLEDWTSDEDVRALAEAARR